MKERRRIHDSKPEAIARRREHAQSPEAKQRASDWARKRLHEVPGLREKRKAASRLWQTGFTPELVAKLLTHQQNKCAICAREFTPQRKHHADHCHETKSSRGLLCLACNTIEGILKHVGLDPVLYAQKLVKYLANPPAKSLI